MGVIFQEKFLNSTVSNYINSFTIFNLLLIIYIFTSNLTYPCIGSTALWDWSSRIRQNDTTLQFHHFFWTTFTYLGPFFLIQVTVVLLPLMNRGKFILLIILGFYLVEVQDYLFVNLFYSELVCNFWNFNLLLTNNLNKYHPHIFYFSTWLLFSLILYQVVVSNSVIKIFTLTKVARKSHRSLYLAKIVNSFALFLGSWDRKSVV